MLDIDREEGVAAIFGALRKNPAYGAWDDAALLCAVRDAIDADIGFMEASGVLSGGEYDEYAAHSAICSAIARTAPKNADITSFADDYMEAWEIYLDSTGAIEWE